jgi:hypothetical protein
VNAISADTVEISSAEGGSVQVRFDPATGLPAGESYPVTGTGGPTRAQDTFSDWRDAGGLKMPYKIATEVKGAVQRETVLVEYKFNTGLTVEDLSRKP